MSSLVSPIVATVVNVLAQIILFRLRRGSQYFRSIIQAFLLGAITLLVGEAFFVATGESVSDRLFLALAVNVPIYLGLSYCYYNFVQLGQTSIRLRMYSEIMTHAAGAMISEIEREYNERDFTEVRLQRLLESGDVIERDGNYFIGRRRLLHIANVIFAAKQFLLGKKSEFE
jgi:hypothetical protein